LPIHLDRDGAVATITIDNGRLSVLTPMLHKELFGHLREFLADPTLHVAILAGSGGSSFCAGDDIKTPRPVRSRAEELDAHLFPHAHEGETPGYPGWEHDIMRLRRFKPIIGAVDGYCLGQGLLYLLELCDLRIATDRAIFGFPEIAYGMGGAGGLTRLARTIPHVDALWVLLTGEKIDAAEALRIHMINRIVAPDALMTEARRVAGTIAAHPPVAVRVEMEAARRCADMNREDALHYAEHLYRLQRMGDSTAGVEPEFLSRGRKV
jgi:enoyl-CoA hydratase/carnithine racemase